MAKPKTISPRQKLSLPQTELVHISDRTGKILKRVGEDGWHWGLAQGNTILHDWSMMRPSKRVGLGIARLSREAISPDELDLAVRRTLAPVRRIRWTYGISPCTSTGKLLSEPQEGRRVWWAMVNRRTEEAWMLQPKDEQHKFKGQPYREADHIALDKLARASANGRVVVFYNKDSSIGGIDNRRLQLPILLDEKGRTERSLMPYSSKIKAVERIAWSQHLLPLPKNKTITLSLTGKTIAQSLRAVVADVTKSDINLLNARSHVLSVTYSAHFSYRGESLPVLMDEVRTHEAWRLPADISSSLVRKLGSIGFRFTKLAVLQDLQRDMASNKEKDRVAKGFRNLNTSVMSRRHRVIGVDGARGRLAMAQEAKEEKRFPPPADNVKTPELAQVDNDGPRISLTLYFEMIDRSPDYEPSEEKARLRQEQIGKNLARQTRKRGA